MIGIDSLVFAYDAAYLGSLKPEQRKKEMHRRLVTRLANQGDRMNRRLARHRLQIWKRHWMMLWVVLFWLSFPAVAIALIALVWQFAGSIVL